MPLSNYLVNDILTSKFDTATVYVALVDGNPGDDGTGGTDVTDTIRPAGRVVCSFSAVAARQVANDAEVSFGNAAGAASVSGFSIWDAATGGNCLATGNLDVTRAVSAGDPVAFLVGDVVVSLPGV